MLRKLLPLTCGALLWLPAFGECVQPESVRIPDGMTATNDEMVDGQMQVKEYMAAMDTYLECLDQESETNAQVRTPEEKDRATQIYNAAVDEMHRIASAFNDQVRAYKAAKP